MLGQRQLKRGGAGRYTKAVVETALLFVKINPAVGVALALLDLTGVRDKAFNW